MDRPFVGPSSPISLTFSSHGPRLLNPAFRDLCRVFFLWTTVLPGPFRVMVPWRRSLLARSSLFFFFLKHEIRSGDHPGWPFYKTANTTTPFPLCSLNLLLNFPPFPALHEQIDTCAIFCFSSPPPPFRFLDSLPSFTFFFFVPLPLPFSFFFLPKLVWLRVFWVAAPSFPPFSPGISKRWAAVGLSLHPPPSLLSASPPVWCSHDRSS